MKTKKHRKKRVSSLEKAIALRYDQEKEHAPRIIAKGQGSTASRIRTIAQKNGIPIHRDTDLVELLSEIELDREIPPELYAAIAEILSWLYKAHASLKKG